ncbi:hypothetical protein ACO0QE_002827 [Hanseniaspora vineae]
MSANREGQSEKKRLTKKEKLEKNIPHFIKNQPWYYGSAPGNEKAGDPNTSKTADDNDRDILGHQRSVARDDVLDVNNKKGYRTSGIRDVYVEYGSGGTRKGKVGVQCKNCGAVGHRINDCLEPQTKRKKAESGILDVGKLGQSAVQQPVFVRSEHGAQSYDSKRDRWYGYTGEDQHTNNKVRSKQSRKNHSGESGEGRIEKLTLDEEIELRILGLQPSDVPGYFKERSHLKLSSKEGLASVRLREDKAVYLKDIKFDPHTVKLSEFQAEKQPTNQKNAAKDDADDEEVVIKYDPKTRIYKDETQGFVNPNNNMFYRYKTGEGLEFETMQKKLKYLQKQNREEDSSLKLVDEKISSKVMIANPTMYERLLKKQEDAAAEGQQKKEAKRDLSKFEAKRAQGKSMDNSGLLKKYK